MRCKYTVDLLLVVTTDYNGRATSSDRIPTIKRGRKNIPINGTEGNHTGGMERGKFLGLKNKNITRTIANYCKRNMSSG